MLLKVIHFAPDSDFHNSDNPVSERDSSDYGFDFLIDGEHYDVWCDFYVWKDGQVYPIGQAFQKVITEESGKIKIEYSGFLTEGDIKMLVRIRDEKKYITINE